LIIEVLEPTNNEILFALDAVLEGLACGVHSFTREESPGGFRWAQRDSAAVSRGI
jgi:hypothetical protein